MFSEDFRQYNFKIRIASLKSYSVRCSWDEMSGKGQMLSLGSLGSSVQPGSFCLVDMILSFKC